MKRRQRNIIIGSIIVGIAISILWYLAAGCNWRTQLDTLFSGLAFAGLICTILLQREDLEATRVELKRTATAQENSEEALNKQIESMNLSTLVNGYSAMLDYYDRHGRNNSGPEAEQSKHMRARLKQLMDHVEALQGFKIDRPSDWGRL